MPPDGRRFVQMNHQSVLIAVMCVFALCPLQGQNQSGPQQPIVLERADSLLGSGQLENTRREFLGNVRFRQGNVTVSCDRAVHYVGTNRAEFIGHVRITQETLIMEAPFMSYDGNIMQCVATGGVSVRDGSRVITSRHGTYSTLSHDALFTQEVRVVDDSARIVADTLLYSRDLKVSTAWGNAVVTDREALSWVRGDTIVHDPQLGNMVARGNAQAWQFGESDTLYLSSDTLHANRGESTEYIARGHAQLVRGSVAARSDTAHYSPDIGVMHFIHQPVLWSDSSMLVADSISVEIPEQILRKVMGRGKALMISRSDTSRPERYDQLGGEQISINILGDTIRSVLAVGDTRSIYYRVEGAEPKGLAQFSSDTTRVLFVEGRPEDIHWTGGIHGEHHPENIVAGRPEPYRLSGFRWRTDRPVLAPPPNIPFLKKVN